MVRVMEQLMGKLKILVALVLILFLSNNCDSEVFADDELTLEKVPYMGNELRIDGYYYLMDNTDGTISATYFFYRDGAILHGGGWPNEDKFEGLESNFTSENWQEGIKDNKLKWGLFQLKDGLIQFERWYPSSGGPTPTYIRSGIIENDTTFIITKSIRPKTGEENELNEVYNFKEFSPKPDSINHFID